MAWGWFAERLMRTLPARAPSRRIAAGLAVSVPVICLATALTLAGHTYSATTAGSGTAITYLLLLPAILLRKGPRLEAGGLPGGVTSGAIWPIWRKTVLPFSLVAAAMWIIMGSTGHFRPIDGQFLITAFLLGTWLFKLESKAHQSPADFAPTSATAEIASDKHGMRRLVVVAATVAAGIGATALAIGGAALLANVGLTGRIAYLMPAAGALTCLGPIVFAARARAAGRGDWGGTLGYAAMAAGCLVPGLAGFLQPAAGSPPLYGPDGAYLALAAGLVLALGEEGLAGNRTGHRVLMGTWGVWLGWVLLSVLLAQDHVTTSPPADWSEWGPV